MKKLFEFDDCRVYVSLLDLVTEGDHTRHGRWELIIEVYDWAVTAILKCQRHRFYFDHDIPGLKFTYATGPREGQEYFWDRSGWDPEPHGALDWLPEEVCLWILGMDELADDIDLKGKRSKGPYTADPRVNKVSKAFTRAVQDGDLSKASALGATWLKQYSHSKK